jgi:dUTP pyrophosphatase
MALDLKVKLIHPDAQVPSRGSIHAAGVDLYAPEGHRLVPGQRKLIPTGLKIAVPHGFYGRVAPRSGIAFKHGIDVLAGVIDSDYRGELGVLLINTGTQNFIIQKGDRIAQLIVEAILTPEVIHVEELDDTERGAGGFGSTG